MIDIADAPTDDGPDLRKSALGRYPRRTMMTEMG
jgi:hypothetical protein